MGAGVLSVLPHGGAIAPLAYAAWSDLCGPRLVGWDCQHYEVEQQLYDKYACWCDKTSARKAKAIEDAQDLLRSLGQQILQLRGKIATLTAEIAQLAQDRNR